MAVAHCQLGCCGQAASTRPRLHRSSDDAKWSVDTKADGGGSQGDDDRPRGQDSADALPMEGSQRPERSDPGPFRSHVASIRRLSGTSSQASGAAQLICHRRHSDSAPTLADLGPKPAALQRLARRHAAAH